MENLREKEFYKEKIIKLLEKIENPAILASVYSFIIGILSVKEKQEAD